MNNRGYKPPAMPASAKKVGAKRDAQAKVIKNNYEAFINTLADDKGKITPVRNHLAKIVSFDPYLKTLFGFNEFTEKIEVLKSFKYGSHIIEKGNFKDRYILIVANYIEDNHNYHLKGSIKKKDMDEALELAQDDNSFNPIIDYFEKARTNWDKQPRIENFFNDFLGVVPVEIDGLDIIKLIAEIFFIGGAQKALDPSYNQQYTLDLIGGQGAGKTTVAKMLAPTPMYYLDSFSDFSDKDNLNRMSEAFIINDDELTATKRTNFSDLKKFLTQNELIFRKPYEKNDTHKIKKFITIRTSNEITYLRDKTGSRRFLPLRVRKERQTKHPVQYLTRGFVEQLWGESVNRLDELEAIRKTIDSNEAIFNKYRSDFEYKDELEDLLDYALKTSFDDWDKIPVTDLCMAIFNDEDTAKHNKEFKKIKFLMESKYNYVNKVYKENGKAIRGYVK